MFVRAALACATLAACGSAAVFAQSSEPARPAGAGRPTSPSRDRERAANDPQEGPPLDRLPGGNLLRMRPEDRRPVAPGEEDALLRFAQEHLPHIHRVLSDARAQNPARFRSALERSAPRLRSLRRLFEERPALAELLVQHIENNDSINRGRRLWADAAGNQGRRQRIASEVRRRVAANLRLELRMLETRAKELDDNCEALADQDVLRLTEEEADLAGEPRDMRRLIQQVREAGDDQARASALESLRAALRERIAGTAASLRDRAASLRDDGPHVVDRRVRDALQADDGPPNAAPANRPRRPGPASGPNRGERP